MSISGTFLCIVGSVVSQHAIKLKHQSLMGKQLNQLWKFEDI